MKSEMLGQPERHKIRMIEELTCKLANSIGNVHGRASAINKFFFGVPEDESKTPSEEAELMGWFEAHLTVLRKLDDRAQDIYNVLGNIHEVIDKK